MKFGRVESDRMDQTCLVEKSGIYMQVETPVVSGCNIIPPLKEEALRASSINKQEMKMKTKINRKIEVKRKLFVDNSEVINVVK